MFMTLSILVEGNFLMLENIKILIGSSDDDLVKQGIELIKGLGMDEELCSVDEQISLLRSKNKREVKQGIQLLTGGRLTSEYRDVLCLLSNTDHPLLLTEVSQCFKSLFRVKFQDDPEVIRTALFAVIVASGQLIERDILQVHYEPLIDEVSIF